MTKKCFWCNKRNWKHQFAPYCSPECEKMFKQSPQRKARLKECKEMKRKESLTLEKFKEKLQEAVK